MPAGIVDREQALTVARAFLAGLAEGPRVLRDATDRVASVTDTRRLVGA